jgi:hypothetical protein
MGIAHADLIVVVLWPVQEADQRLTEVQLLCRRILLDSVRAERDMRHLAGYLPLGAVREEGRELQQVSKGHPPQAPVRD